MLNSDLVEGSHAVPASRVPIATIANEILIEIFTYCLPDPPLDHDQPDVTIAPLLLCRVCALWRSVVLHCPELWGALKLTLRSHLDRDVQGRDRDLNRHLKALKFWIKHGANVQPAFLLQLRTDEQWNVDGVESRSSSRQVWQDILSAICLSSPRHISLDGLSEVELGYFKNLNCPRSLDNLKYLALQDIMYHRKGTQFKLPFPSCPALERFSCFNSVSIFAIEDQISWGNITHLHLSFSLPVLKWFTLIKTCVKLEFFLVSLEELMCTDDFVWPRTRDFTHHSLQRMSLDGGEDFWSDYFSIFVFPSLISLRISNPTAPLYLYHLSRIAHVAPNLKELHLHSCIHFSLLTFEAKVNPYGLSIQMEDKDYTLSASLPTLERLVVDGTLSHWSCPLERGILAFLQTRWVFEGWTPTSRRRHIEIIVGQRSKKVDEAAKQVAEGVEAIGGHPFGEVIITPSVGWLWEWSGTITPDELTGNWVDVMKFSSV